MKSVSSNLRPFYSRISWYMHSKYIHRIYKHFEPIAATIDHSKAQNNEYPCIQKFLIQARKYMKYDLLNLQPRGMRKTEKNQEMRMSGKRKKNSEQMQPYYEGSGHQYFLRAQRKPLIKPEWSRVSWFLTGAKSLHLEVSFTEEFISEVGSIKQINVDVSYLFSSKQIFGWNEASISWNKCISE